MLDGDVLMPTTEEMGRKIAKELRETMRCFCDLDNWQPDRRTGHSCVCPIHKLTMERLRDMPIPGEAN